MNEIGSGAPGDVRHGLSSDEAARRLARFGPNVPPSDGRSGVLGVLREAASEPMFLLLFAAAAIYALIGEPVEAAALGVFACVSIGLVLVQEVRSVRALAALRDLSAPRAHVLRDGTRAQIDARALVPGDVVFVHEGDRAPADLALFEAFDLCADESLLTGESVPVRKRPAPNLAAVVCRADAVTPGGEDAPFIYAGALLVRGRGAGVAIATGEQSALGRIGASLARIEEAPTPLQQAVGRLVRLFGGLAFLVCATLTIAHGVLLADWVAGALAGITLAMGMIPEEFPMVLAVFLGMGALRLARVRVLARRGAAVETLGAASFIALDKTGTLTANQMRLEEAWTPADGRFRLDAGAKGLAALLDVASAASRRDGHDPMDKAIVAAATASTVRPDTPDTEYPLTPERLAIIRVWAEGDTAIAAAKGAPEAIFALCRLSPRDRAEAEETAAQMAGEGLRILGVAVAHPSGPLPEDPSDLGFALVGLVGFLDPLRPGAREAIAAANAAGIEIAMITGDHPETARAIARSAGIALSGGVLTGPEIARLGPGALADAVALVRVFARVQPEQKLTLVRALQERGRVVAMTGDGVNDAPALKAAHIGVAMGRRGSDVAREAADIVLLDDDFPAMVQAIRTGRRITDNLVRVLRYIAAIHVPIAALALLPLLLGLPPMLYPLHVVTMELLIDPTCSIAFENAPEDKNLMRRPPRKFDAALFGPRELRASFLYGGLATLAPLGLYVAFARDDPDLARTLGFVALVCGALGLSAAFAAGRRPVPPLHRPVFAAIALVAAAFLALVLLAPGLRALFQFTLPDAGALAAAVVLGSLGGLLPLTPAILRIRTTHGSRT